MILGYVKYIDSNKPKISTYCITRIFGQGSLVKRLNLPIDENLNCRRSYGWIT